MNRTEMIFFTAGILSAVMFADFLLSGITADFHLGCAAGMAVTGALCMIFFRHEDFCGLIFSVWQTKSGKKLLIFAAAVISLCIIVSAVLSALMIKAADRLPDKPETVIVLGCKVKENGPSLMLQKRIESAYEYLSENEGAICIASGGKGSDEPVSEAESIRDSLVKMGISSDRIICEDKSENTFQNIRNSMAILDSLGKDRKAVIVTSEFHQLRAGIICSKQGLEAYSKSSRTYLPLLPSYWVREWFGLVHEIIIGRK